MPNKIGGGASQAFVPAQIEQQAPITSQIAVESVDETTALQAMEVQSAPNSMQAADVALTQARPAMAGQSILGLLGGGGQVASSDSIHLFGLAEGQLQDAVGLDVVLDSIPKTPEGEQAIKNLVGVIQGHTGINVEPSMLDAIVAKPSRMANLLMLSPSELGRGIQALNMRHQAEGGGAPSSSKPELPNNVDIANLSELPIERPQMELKEIGPGLLRGDKPSDMSDTQAKTNIAMAGIFDRLAANPTAGDGDKFSVDYNGQSFDSIDTFLQALKDDGHEVEVTVKQRIANFAGLHTQTPDGNIVDVPAPLFVKTGIKDENGEEAVVPATHSELVLSVRSGDNTEGPGVNTDIRFFQGISGTGFFPDGLFQEPSWSGGTERTIGTGDKAIEAMQLAGLMTDTINDSSEDQDLWLGGYGVTGVCNDSVAVIEHAMTGANLTYPLMMQDDVLMPELEERIDSGGPNQGLYERLLDSIEALPNDRFSNDSVRERALHSLPWAEGQETFQSSATARKILGE